jgi:hypothetical protein
MPCNDDDARRIDAALKRVEFAASRATGITFGVRMCLESYDVTTLERMIERGRKDAEACPQDLNDDLIHLMDRIQECVPPARELIAEGGFPVVQYGTKRDIPAERRDLERAFSTLAKRLDMHEALRRACAFQAVCKGVHLPQALQPRDQQAFDRMLEALNVDRDGYQRRLYLTPDKAPSPSPK